MEAHVLSDIKLLDHCQGVIGARLKKFKRFTCRSFWHIQWQCWSNAVEMGVEVVLEVARLCFQPRKPGVSEEDITALAALWKGQQGPRILSAQIAAQF